MYTQVRLAIVVSLAASCACTGADPTISPGAGGTNGSGGSAATGGTTNAKMTGGAPNTSGGTGAYNPCPAASTPCKVLPFGDSITDGYTVLGGYRIELFTLAHQAGKNITFVGSGANGPTTVDGVAFPRNHEGHDGYTIDDEPQASRSGISPLVNSVMSTYTPHIVLLMIGTNDINRNIDIATAPNRLAALIDSILAASSTALLVVAQIVPTGTDATNINVQAYNSAIPAIIKARADFGQHILMVDMYSVIASDANFKTTLLNADGLHPTTAGYALLGQTWYTAVSGYFH